MVKRPTGSGGEPSSPNCGVSAEGRARHLSFSLCAKEMCDPYRYGVMAEKTTQETQASTNTPKVSESAGAPEAPSEPDAIQPFINQACETVQHEVTDEELNKFLRAHIKTFRKEWDVLSDNAKVTYIHMMTSQLLQRKAAATQIRIGNEFKLPVPSAQTQMFESIQRPRIKPLKCRPALLLPPDFRPLPLS